MLCEHSRVAISISDRQLFLTFRLGGESYALNALHVHTVLPAVALRRLDQAPAYVAGLLDYQGQALPVLDLCQMCLERPTASHYSTRIVVVHYPTPRGGSLLGLRAEKVTELVRCSAEQFQALSFSLPESRLLGEVGRVDSELVSLVRIEQLLSPEVRDLLFPADG